MRRARRLALGVLNRVSGRSEHLRVYKKLRDAEWLSENEVARDPKCWIAPLVEPCV